MKLIIDIDDELVETARFAVHLDMGSDYVKSIARGISLDNLRAEIEEIKTDTMYKYVGDFRYGVDTVIEIIDKYKTENEDKR